VDFLVGEADKMLMSDESVIPSLVKDGKFLNGVDSMVEQSTFYGYPPARFQGFLSAALESGDPALASKTFDYVRKMGADQISLRALNTGESKGTFMQIRSLNSLGLPDDQTYALYQKGREISKDEKDRRLEGLKNLEIGEFFDKNLDDSLEAAYDVPGFIPFTQIAPNIKENVRLRVKTLMTEQMAVYGIEDPQQGMKMAMALFTPTMAVKTIGKVNVLTSVDQTIPAAFSRDGIHTDEQTNAWVNESLQTEFAKVVKNGGISPDFDLPYDYHIVNKRVGGKSIKALQVFTYDSQGFPKYYNAIAPVFIGTKQYTTDMRAAEVKRATDKAIAEAAALVAAAEGKAIDSKGTGNRDLITGTTQADVDTRNAQFMLGVKTIGAKVWKSMIGDMETIGVQQDYE
jgi:hypothetical protein